MTVWQDNTGVILGLHPANERQCLSLAGHKPRISPVIDGCHSLTSKLALSKGQKWQYHKLMQSQYWPINFVKDKISKQAPWYKNLIIAWLAVTLVGVCVYLVAFTLHGLVMIHRKPLHIVMVDLYLQWIGDKYLPILNIPWLHQWSLGMAK